ncbi:Os04g0374175 [Oryza sativa Japonica Group]|uniref:Os04g0374175 protein n=1 Tax=Oryza sativa subsp. japonica TaxID=39947 RepID=C7J198_ORYSJ|nr:Os04g0374175 [Oryza sativa Japonica Group]|eukprot:NP_001173899.1 Os04g0374175 [Oryza sativa Japonica Group]
MSRASVTSSLCSSLPPTVMDRAQGQGGRARRASSSWCFDNDHPGDMLVGDDHWMPCSCLLISVCAARRGVEGGLTDKAVGDAEAQMESEQAGSVRMAPKFSTYDHAAVLNLAMDKVVGILRGVAGVAADANAFREFFHWVTPHVLAAVRSQQQQQLLQLDSGGPVSASTGNNRTAPLHQIQDDLQKLEHNLWVIQTTITSTMHDLIDRLEWHSHRETEARHLRQIKDAVYDAEDLLDEYNYYALKVKVEASKNLGQDHSHGPVLEFLDSVNFNGNFSKVMEIQDRLKHVFDQSMGLGLHKTPKKFDRLVRPETCRVLDESQIFGREQELKELMQMLGVDGHKRGRPAAHTNTTEARRMELPVLPIVGMGGVGKTTMAQQICEDPEVRKHFHHRIIWICVSDEFEVNRLTKDALKSLGVKSEDTDTRDNLMVNLRDSVKSKKFLLVLDDMWDDVLKDEKGWRTFHRTLSNGLDGSMILVTTRSSKVANLVSDAQLVSKDERFIIQHVSDLAKIPPKTINAKGCVFKRYPQGFSDLISLKKIESKGFIYNKDKDKQCLRWPIMRTPDRGEARTRLSPPYAPNLALPLTPEEQLQMTEEQIELLPHWNLQHLTIEYYLGQSCPSWLRPDCLKMLTSLKLSYCKNIQSISFFDPLFPDSEDSKNICHLEVLDIQHCPNINWQGLVALPSSLRKIILGNFGHSTDHFVSCFCGLALLKCLQIQCEFLMSIPLQVCKNNLQALEDLHIYQCSSLTSIYVSEASSRHPVGVFSSLSSVTISLCNALLSLDEFLMPAYMPVVKTILVESCRQLALLPIDELHRFSCLEVLRIESCPNLNTRRIMTLPSSLRKLSLLGCPSIEFIDNSHLASSVTLKGLNLKLVSCPDLISIVGAISISEIQSGYIHDCPKLMEMTQPFTRGRYWREPKESAD